MPSRISRASALRVILPSVTMQPAIVPTLLTLNVFRTSAWPMTSSLYDRIEHAFHGLFDLFDHVVDDAMQADVDLSCSAVAFALRLRPDVEADDDRVGRGCQHDVRFGDGADAGVNDLDADAFDVDFLQRAFRAPRPNLARRL